MLLSVQGNHVLFLLVKYLNANEELSFRKGFSDWKRAQDRILKSTERPCCHTSIRVLNVEPSTQSSKTNLMMNAIIGLKFLDLVVSY